MDMCGQLEVENSRLSVDVQVKESQLKDLQRQTEEENEELERTNKERREVNLEQISLRRDRAHLEAEIKHLQTLLDDGTASVTLLSQQQMQLEHQVEAIQAQTRQLDEQRREASEEHKAEVSRLRQEQLQTSAVISDYSQLKRDEIETAKQNANKKNLNNQLYVLNTKPDTDKYTSTGIERDVPPTSGEMREDIII
ncbi:liver stage antigen-1, putative [Perkinsus marinus ATCC 50983]|uniref:Liver stage antigen-1, putative n=1 Tax=Perkinsus marinus (strain ATCC 50983 / TXsc) TaxID=423536 RepID=C5LNJ4_PERM5|nr:liver stage antigen-1, putative [Perkinsus marinus ATCC 50983]EER01745.1 liver stage antigen-1, putative [Perkinsus marinus ATCC 50983]|eukprot:XP_002769027.1 liver stage antigen-1, putative [Perkinsus marinus ATCC 50983]